MAKRRKNRSVAPLFLILIVLAVGMAILISRVVGGNIKNELTVEAGSAKPSATDFIIEDEGKDAVFVEGEDKIDTSVIGKYAVSIEYDGKTYKSTVNVKDTVPPSAAAKNVTAVNGDPVDAESFVTDIVDATKVTVGFKSEPDTSKDGKFDVTVVLTDEGNNKTEITATLTVVSDVTPPVIEGANDITAYVGEPVSFRSGVTVTDDTDENPQLSVDDTGVDLSRTGIYRATYIATDAAGNESKAEVTVTVREKSDSSVDTETVFKEADKLIAKIITDSMSKREQVEAIYNYARSKWSYSGHSDKSDWLAGAYTMLKKNTGDCYNYYAATKLLFERLGIDNIDVQKVRNYTGDSDHFWSLVSLDGGQTWYHFDSTPRKGTGDDFCLVTDAFIDAYSDSHKKSHNRDKSLYPATPQS